MPSTTVPAIFGFGGVVAVGLGSVDVGVDAGVGVGVVAGTDELGCVGAGVGVLWVPWVLWVDGSSLHAASVVSESTPLRNSTRRVARTPPP
jgi:hypothetical protein